MAERKNPRIVMLPQHIEDRGTLVVCEGDLHVPFTIQRAFWMHGMLKDSVRGGHGHESCEQLIVMISGSCTMYFDPEDLDNHTYHGDPHYAWHIPAGCYVKLTNFSEGAVVLVLASEHFSEEDYIDGSEIQ